MKLNIIVAYETSSRGIGYKGNIPWFFPNDLKYFSKLTKGNGNNAIIMGRKTWESLSRKPLPKRKNIIITKQANTCVVNNDESYFTCIKDAITSCENNGYEETWIIGGFLIYKEVIENYNIDKIYITEINKFYECDTFFPEIPCEYSCISETKEHSQGISINYKVFQKS